MQLAQLSSVKHRVHLGAPLPFNVRDADKTLLLARGQRIQSDEQLEALFSRGALVDLAELQTAREEISKAPRGHGGGLGQEDLLDAIAQGAEPRVAKPVTPDRQLRQCHRPAPGALCLSAP